MSDNVQPFQAKYLPDLFIDRYLRYEKIMHSEYTVLYKVTVDASKELMCYDVFMTYNLERCTDSFTLYPPDKRFVCSQHAETINVEKSDVANEALIEAVITFDKFRDEETKIINN